MKQKGYFKAVTSPGTTNKGIVKGSIMYWNNRSHVALVAYVSSTTVKYFQHSDTIQSSDAKFYDSKNDDITFYSPTATIS